VRLDDIRGFVFDLDGTLVHRGPDGRAAPLPGAVEVLERIRSTGRPLVVFTNASHASPAVIARELREDSLPVRDTELVTPIESATSYLCRRHASARVLAFVTEATRTRLVEAGIALTQDDGADVVLVAHVDHLDFGELERAARAVEDGAPLLTASWARGYAGANGLVYSRGAMATAAIAKAAGARPQLVGKPSRAAIAEVRARLGVPLQDVAVIGDDIAMDVVLGRIGGCRTVLVRTGVSGTDDLERVPASRRPDAVVRGVGDLLVLL
jgi:HAD superfamily hydrolase (TIGR01450 family)